MNIGSVDVPSQIYQLDFPSQFHTTKFYIGLYTIFRGFYSFKFIFITLNNV